MLPEHRRNTDPPPTADIPEPLLIKLIYAAANKRCLRVQHVIIYVYSAPAGGSLLLF